MTLSTPQIAIAAALTLVLAALAMAAWIHRHDARNADVGGTLKVAVSDLHLPVSAPAAEVSRVRLWHPLPDDAAAPRRFPVLLYFPGWPGVAVDNVHLIREFASRGYLVAAVEYPQADVHEPFLDLASDGRFQASVSRNDRRVAARARDAVAILDRLASVDADGSGPLAHRLQIAEAGILGFSFGGAVAAEACRLDRRFVAAANLDGLHFAGAAREGVDRPYLYVSDDSTLPDAADLEAQDPGPRALAMRIRNDDADTRINLQRHGGIYARLAGSQHENFSDDALRFRLRRTAEPGAIDPMRAHRIVTAYLLAFFGRHLQGQPSPLLLGSSASYPEMRVQVWKGMGG